MDKEHIRALLIKYIKDNKITFTGSDKTICNTYIVHLLHYKNIVLNIYRDKQTFEIYPYTNQHQIFTI